MRSLGLKIEQQAKQFLLKQHLVFVKDNFYSRFGEIDLIMLDEETLCFIEVRHRKNNHFGSAAESITLTKQQKIQKTALYFIQTQTKYQQHNYRFDVMLSQGEQQPVMFEWIKNAF